MLSNNVHCFPGCRLCVEIDDFERSLFHEKYPENLTQNVFFERTRTHVMIPIGPYCPGHLLIASRRHEWSFGHFHEDIIPELLNLIDDVSHFLKKHLDKERIVVFEHGPLSSHERGGACLNHAHFNILPIPNTFPLYQKASELLDFKPIELHQLGDFIKRGEPYLFFHCSREGTFGAAAPIGCTQFFRKVLASSHPGNGWDWRSDPKVEVVRKMANLLKDS